MVCAVISSVVSHTKFTRGRATQDRTADEIRKTFGIENDFSPEEEKQILEESKWCDAS